MRVGLKNRSAFKVVFLYPLCYLTSIQFECLRVKRLFLIGVVGLAMAGCGESDIEKLSNKQDKLSKEIAILNAKAVEPAAECDKLSAVYLSLVDKTTSEAEANKKKVLRCVNRPLNCKIKH